MYITFASKYLINKNKLTKLIILIKRNHNLLNNNMNEKIKFI